MDTRATDHMLYDSTLLHNKRRLVKPISIALPDGSVKLVDTIGTVRFNSLLTLQNVLLVPSFKHNLLSVGKLLEDSNLMASFASDMCVFRDLTTKDNVDKGKRMNGFYIIKAS